MKMIRNVEWNYIKWRKKGKKKKVKTLNYQRRELYICIKKQQIQLYSLAKRFVFFILYYFLLPLLNYIALYWSYVLISSSCVKTFKPLYLFKREKLRHSLLKFFKKFGRFHSLDSFLRLTLKDWINIKVSSIFDSKEEKNE